MISGISESASFQVSIQTRINFAKVRASACVSDKIKGQIDRRFVLSAKYGQWLTASVSSRNGCIQFTNISAVISDQTRTGNDYLYIINHCRKTTSFTITVSIIWGE
jgi:hypothetical protein